MMQIDGEIAFEETMVYMNITKQLQDELSSPYDRESKLGKFVWGDPWKSVDTNRGNLTSIIRTMDEGGRQMLFENCLIVAISDKDFDSSEQHYLVNLICDVYDCTKDEGVDKIEELFLGLTNKITEDRQAEIKERAEQDLLDKLNKGEEFGRGSLQNPNKGVFTFIFRAMVILIIISTIIALFSS